MSKANTILSKLAVAVGIFDQGIKQFFFNMFQVDTVAAAGTTQATGTVLLASRNAVTGANGTAGVVLPRAVDGAKIEIVNTVANLPLLVYPQGSTDVINGLAATTALAIPGGAHADFYCSANGQWQVVVTSIASVTPSGVETGLTAHAGGTQAAAFALSATKSVHEVTTVGSANDSVKLPPAIGSGNIHVVKNSAAANSMQLFGSGTDTIDGVATGTGVAVVAGKGRLLVDADAGNWISVAGA